MEVEWSNFKSFVNSRGLSVQWVVIGSNYHLVAIDGPFQISCVLPTDETIDDVLDFVNNFKTLGNKRFSDSEGVQLNRNRAFANSDGFRFRGLGISATATKNTTTNIDYLIPQDRYMNGVSIILKNQVFGDTASFQIVDKDNVLGYGAGTVLDEFATDWNMSEDSQDQGAVLLPYPAKVIAGLYIRIVYKSVGTENDVLVRANLFLHWKAA